ncbi:MAG: quinone-dependent dihydroorotate dehydrogenase [Cytophagales bacterium]
MNFIQNSFPQSVFPSFFCSILQTVNCWQLYKYFIRPLLFGMDAEQAHHFTFKVISIISSFFLGRMLLSCFYGKHKKSNPITVAGIEFPNRVGLAAGFDKDGKLLNAWNNLGFGFVEVGTVTPLPQSGNEKPRLFRIINEKAIINRMGFNNEGLDALVKRLENRPKNLVVGGNIGKNKATPNENAVDDYLKCLKALHHCVDYFVVNVSSPNTPNLRELQEKEPLKKILKTLQIENQKFQKPKPIFLKIAPDLNESQLDDIVEIVLETELAGVVSGNTTIRRDLLINTEKQLVDSIGAGGLSGKPLKEFSDKVLHYLAEKASGKFEIIAVGGIFEGKDALDKIKSGAKLVQVYTGYVYQGPSMVSKINSFLKRHL